MIAKEIMLTFYCCLNLVYAKPQYQEPVKIFWKDVKPGELLKSLDAITATAQHLTQAKQMEDVNNKNAFPKQSANSFRFKKGIDEELAGSTEERIPYDYDKAYEEFVKKYFEDSVTNAFSGSDSTEYMQHEAEEEMLSGEDHEPVKESSKISVKLEKCKNIVKNQQNCLICKNSKTKESSEICSYKKEIKPTGNEFEKKNNYRQNRAKAKKNTNEGSSEHFSRAKATTSFKKQKKSKKNIQV